MKQIETIFDSFQSTKELVYYMDSYYTDRSEMLYIYKKSIEPLYNNLSRVNSNIEAIRFYCDKPGTLLVGPFLSSEDLPLDEESKAKLDGLRASDILWKVVPGTFNHIPEIYAYKKIYSSRYNGSVGFMEIEVSSSLLMEFQEAINNITLKEAAFFLYDDNNEMIYKDSPFTITNKLLRKIQSDNSFFYEYITGNFAYRIYNKRLGISITTVIPSHVIRSSNIRLLFVCSTVLLVLLLSLSLWFLTDISHLSDRIRTFSLYFKDLRKKTLLPYQEPRHLPVLAVNDEFSDLIDSFNEMVQKNSDLSTALNRLELLTKDARLATMQAQIHPHFIYGTLESIRMLALQNNDSDVEEMILTFSKFMRYSLTNPSEKSNIENELYATEQYLKIQLLRLGDRLRYSLSIDPSVKDTTCPPFILQPLVENSIVHGISHTLDPCEIRINIIREPSDIIITVANTGVVITPERLSEVNSLLQKQLDVTSFQSNENGFALNNINERLTLFYHGKASLLLSTESGWTISTLKIQIENKE